MQERIVVMWIIIVVVAFLTILDVYQRIKLKQNVKEHWGKLPK